MNGARSRARNIWLAAALAVVAGVLTLLYVGQGKSGSAGAAVGPTVRVLVATQDLPVGTSASQALASGAIAPQAVPAEAVEKDALPGSATLAGQVVVQPIYKGEQVSTRRFGPSGSAGVRSVLTGTMRILQVPGDANQLLAGTLQDGDHVDVLATVRKGTNQTPVAGIVLRNILVLRAPVASSTTATAGTSTLSAALELTDAEAARLFYVLKNGDWSLALRPAAHAKASTVAQKSADNVLLNG